MRGNKDVAAALAGLLKSEFAAIHQHTVHSSIVSSWGYGVLSAEARARAIQEMRHADSLIDRLLFLEQLPDAISIGQVAVGSSVQAMIELDAAAESRAIAEYNAAISVCVVAGDNGTRDLLAGILADEERHLSDLEASLVQIRQASIGPFLARAISHHEP